MKLSKEEALKIIRNNNEGWETILSSMDTDSGWLSAPQYGIFKHLSSNKLYKLEWCQDEMPFEYSEPNLIEVYPVEKTVVLYEKVT